VYIETVPYRQCKKSGCINLVPVHGSSGYCPDHANIPLRITRSGFDRLKECQAPQERAFYSSAAWTNASLHHRTLEPLCRRCKAEGSIVVGVLVHHNPPLAALLAEGKSPLDNRYLETLCLSHHQKELKK
jgi:hypothetical protein